MDREKLIEYMLGFMPLLHKKLFKDFHCYDYSRQQIILMKIIQKDYGKPMKYYGEKMMISKPNLTTVVNKLEGDGLIKRKDSENDRRIINLFLTEKGHKLLDFHTEQIKQDMLVRLEVLNDNDIKKLNENFEEMSNIFSKLV